MAFKIDTVTARDKLKPRREPYWHRISKGNYLGYRRMGADGGTWIARSFDEGTRKQVYNPVGGFSELPDHQRFDAAARSAREWFDHLGRGGSTATATIRQVCARYVAHLRLTKTASAADDAESRFARYVLDNERFAELEVAKLTPAQVQTWRKSLQATPSTSGPNRGQPRSAGTLNRDMTCFRAALNLAFSDGLVTTDFAWRAKLVPMKNADGRRELYLDREQRRQLVNAAAADLAGFLRGLSMLPLRPGALAGLRVGDFDRRLQVLKIGQDKHGKDRKLKLPPSTAAFFAAACQDKLPAAPLLARANGKAWDKDAWKWPVQAAVAAAGLPEGTTAYTLRHSTISDLVHDGLDLLTVAQVSGTSVRMIEQHYGHLRSEVAADALARLAL